MISDLVLSVLKQRESYKGLTSAKAKENFKKYGPNSRPIARQMNGLKRLWHIFTEPMMLLILVTAAVYFIIKDIFEGAIILLSVIPIGLMEFFQQRRTDQAIKLLDKMVVTTCNVYRDGQRLILDSKYLVPGDLVYLVSGDQVPADGYLLNSPGLMLDESVLTGESLAVVKAQAPAQEEKISEENKLYQGTLVVQGEGYFLVEKTGGQTAYGQLGTLLEKIEKQITPLQRKIESLVRTVAILAFIGAGLVAVILIMRDGLISGILGGLTMAMSLIPEEFPIVFSVFLIMGVWRMSQRRAMVRQMEMVETLGSATVICTDKTGTLTEGRMSLEKIYWQNQVFDIKNYSQPPSGLQDFITSALLALERVATDPLEIEVQRYAKDLKIKVDEVFDKRKLVKDSPFEAKTKMVHHLWQDVSGACAQYTAGAPEFVLDICDISAGEKETALKTYEKLAGEGYRLVAVAKNNCVCSSEIVLKGLQFVGLLAMSDPPRPQVKEAIAFCQRAGIRVIMVTGDSRLTAHKIAETIQLSHNDDVMTGDRLENMSAKELVAAVLSHDIFARVRPEQKLSIVEALQSTGEVVAMTGDGVNDAPALKKADIGVAMGKRGTEVARAAAGIILLDDNFTTIVEAVKEGRRIYDNLRKSFVFLFSFHLPIVGLAVIPVMLGAPLIFLPIHIIFLELICDPSAVLGFEREKARRGLMEEPPRSPGEPLINPRLVSQTLVQGFSILLVSLGFYYFYGFRTGDLELGRTVSFGALVASQVFLILLTREWSQIKSNLLLSYISAATLVFLTASLYLPFLRQLFHFVTIGPGLFAEILIIPFLVMSTVGLWAAKRSTRV